jgi:hypothetical protein
MRKAPSAIHDRSAIQVATRMPATTKGKTTSGMTGITTNRKVTATPTIAAISAESRRVTARPRERPIATPPRTRSDAATNRSMRDAVPSRVICYHV